LVRGGLNGLRIKAPKDFVTYKKLWYNIDDKPLKEQLKDRTKITT
jgi:hypothetical protein